MSTAQDENREHLVCVHADHPEKKNLVRKKFMWDVINLTS